MGASPSAHPSVGSVNPACLPEPQRLPQVKGRGCSDCGHRGGNKEAGKDVPKRLIRKVYRWPDMRERVVDGIIHKENAN